MAKIPDSPVRSSFFRTIPAVQAPIPIAVFGRGVLHQKHKTVKSVSNIKTGILILILSCALADTAAGFQPAVSDSLAPQGMYSPAMIGLVAVGVEGVLAAGSATTRYPAGAYIIGGFQGIYALTLAGSAFGETENPYPRFMMAAGLGYLSYYNFRFQGSHSNSRKFWTNFAGVNAAAGAALITYLLLPDRGFKLFAARQHSTALDVFAAGAGMGMRLRF